jgi:hypothetical protein
MKNFIVATKTRSKLSLNLIKLKAAFIFYFMQNKFIVFSLLLVINVYTQVMYTLAFEKRVTRKDI